MTVTIGNLDRYYNADKPRKCCAVSGNRAGDSGVILDMSQINDGKIEWLDPFNGYLKKMVGGRSKGKVHGDRPI